MPYAPAPPVELPWLAKVQQHLVTTIGGYLHEVVPSLTPIALFDLALPEVRTHPPLLVPSRFLIPECRILNNNKSLHPVLLPLQSYHALHSGFECQGRHSAMHYGKGVSLVLNRGTYRSSIFSHYRYLINVLLN
jgi:hypothetical protein